MNNRLALRYAKALFQNAEAQNLTERVTEDIESIAAVFRESSGLLSVLKKVSRIPELSMEVVQDIKKKLSLSPVTAHFLDVLANRKRLEILYDITLGYIDLIKTSRGIIRVKVISSRDLAAEEKAMILNRLQEVIGRPVEIEWIIDASILGGLKVKIGDQIYDGSLESRIHQLRKQLIHV